MPRHNICSTPWFWSSVWIPGSDVTLYALMTPFFCLMCATTFRVHLNGSSLCVNFTMNSYRYTDWSQKHSEELTADNSLLTGWNLARETAHCGTNVHKKQKSDPPFPSLKLATLPPGVIFRKKSVKKRRCNNTPSAYGVAAVFARSHAEF